MQHGRSCVFMLLFQLLLCSVVGDTRPVAGMVQYLADLVKGQIAGKAQINHGAIGLLQSVDPLVQCDFLGGILHDIIQPICACGRKSATDDGPLCAINYERSETARSLIHSFDHSGQCIELPEKRFLR